MNAAAEGDKKMTSKDLASDEAAKGSLHQECMAKATDFEQATKDRGAELKALAEAKKALKENTGSATDISYDSASFVQLSSSSHLAQYEVVRSLRDLAMKQKLPQLAQLASRVASVMHAGEESGEDVFAKVKGLISDLLARLEDEAAADATEKAFCDKELRENNEKKDDKEAEIAKLTTRIDQRVATSKKLKSEVAALQKALANLAQSQAEMDKMRQEEHASFLVNQADMEQGLDGVKTALNVLREYYASDDKAHGAAEGAGAGIISLLEVCESDFSKSLAEINATEENAQQVYTRQTKDNEIEKTNKDQDVKYKTQEYTRLDKAVADMSTDRSGVQAELDAVNDVLDKLHSRCDEVAETYAERKAARAQELEGLKQALDILESQAALVQITARHAPRQAHLQA